MDSTGAAIYLYPPKKHLAFESFWKVQADLKENLFIICKSLGSSPGKIRYSSRCSTQDETKRTAQAAQEARGLQRAGEVTVY